MKTSINRAGRMRQRIIVQKNIITKDTIGNHIEEWMDFYSCAAYANKASGREYGIAGQTVTEETLIFEVRWCKKLECLESTKFRILFNGAIYNIISVDDIQFCHAIIKIIAEKERR